MAISYRPVFACRLNQKKEVSMIQIKILSGPYAGQSKTSADIAADDVDPVALTVELACQKWWWEFDWSDATPEEYVLWGRADMVGRLIAAAITGRAVRFMGQRWSFAGLEFASDEAQLLLGAIEDSISGSGRNVVVLTDDWVGDLVIGVRGYEEGSGPQS